MKKRILLICALLVSVITLSGAANRSFHTTLEQWNPIGITQAQAGVQTTNPTAGNAILPATVTAAPSGVLRGGSTNVITFTTAKAVGETVKLAMTYTGAAPTLSGLDGIPRNNKEVTYKLTSQKVTITGDVTQFKCSIIQLTALDVSNNTALEALECDRNQLTTLNVSKNTALKVLSCTNNQLTGLDLSHNTALTILVCYANQLTGLDLSQNTALTLLDCSNNQLPVLDLSQNSALIDLACSNNKLTALDLSQNSALTNVDCDYNKLTALNLPQNSALECLRCSNNQLTALALSQNTALTELNCSNNQLTALDLSQNTALTGLNCSNNQLHALDLSQNSALKELVCTVNQLTALDLSKNTALTWLGCYGNQIKGEEMTRLVNSLPDLSGKPVGAFIVIQEPAPEGNVCFKSEVAIAKGKNWKTEKLNSESLETSDYEGAANVITFKTDKAVGETIVLSMEYTGDAPKLTGLTGTPVRGKEVTYPLTAQEVTITGDVTQFKCSNNKLTALDLSENTALTKLWCEKNELTTLDVSHNTALTFLCCNDNQLTALDVSQNDALTWLGCINNQIKGKEMTRLVNSLPDRTDKPAGTFLVIQEQGSEGNRCLKKDVAIAKGKNWNAYKSISDGDKNDLVPYEGEEPIPYAVTLTKEGEGTITATGADDLKAVPEGTELTVVATPAAGYELTALTANGTDILATKKVVVTGATEVKATFTKKTYAVTLAKEGEGTLTATGADDLKAVPEGTELTIEATPAAGYELKALTANGTDILATKKVVVKGATEVKATFTKKTAADRVEAGTLCLYPNPAGTYVNVKAAKADALVRLYDANGTLRYEARTDANGTLQIDLSAYAEGTYLLRVGDNAQRLLIQR